MTILLSRRTPPARAARGVSLIEVLIAVLILAIGMLGVAALQSSALRNSQSSLERSQAVIYQYTILDSMRSNVTVARNGGYEINYPLVVGACTVPAAGDLAANDQLAWMTSLRQTMGNTACGSIHCDAVAPPATTARCEVRVRWDDGRGTAGTEKTIGTVSQI